MGKLLVVVLGMHRSGTSAMARALRCFDIELGDKLMSPAAHNNSKGFYEDLDLVAFNEELLSLVGARWDSLDPAIESKVGSSDTDPLRARARDLLRRKTARVEALGLKDPRMARLMPFWRPIFSELGFDTRYILSLRHPLSVAESLARRDGFAREKSTYLWLAHTVSALVQTRGELRAVMDFDRLVDRAEPELRRAGDALDLSLRINEDELRLFTTDFLERSLRHSCFDTESLDADQRAPPLVRHLYLLLSQVARDDRSLEAPETLAAIEQHAGALERSRPAMQLVADIEGGAAIVNSRSWMLTEPLRAARQLLRSFRWRE